MQSYVHEEDSEKQLRNNSNFELIADENNQVPEKGYFFIKQNRNFWKIKGFKLKLSIKIFDENFKFNFEKNIFILLKMT